MVSGKVSAPFPITTGLAQPALQHALEGGTTLFAAPAGFVSTSQLSGLLRAQQMPALWLHAGPEDRDPANLLLSLARGTDALYPGAGRRTLERMRAQPGPVSGWAPLFSGLARDIADAAQGGPDLGLVIQHIHPLYAASATLALLHDVFLPLLPARTASILISHLAPPRGGLPGYIIPLTARDLRMTEIDALALVDECFHAGGPAVSVPALPASSLRRMIGLAEGCAAALTGLCALVPWLGGRVYQQIIEAATGRVDLMARVSRCCLQAGPQEHADLLALAFRLDYLRPEVAQHALNLPVSDYQRLLSAGWLQTLEGGQAWLNCVWHEPLHLALHPTESSQRRTLKLAAEYLTRSGEAEQAIPLLIDLRCFDEAADALVQVAESMMNYGQWDTLATWLAALPEGARRERPWLVYTEGELAATHGDPRTAQRIFAAATRLFTTQNVPEGACSSLLAESILAARQDHAERASQYARQVQQMAAEANLAWFQGWAGWQLGCLAACAGRMSEAAGHFSQALSAANVQRDASMAGVIGQALEMTQTILNLQRALAKQRQAAEETAQAGREAVERMRFLLQKPSRPAAALLGEHGWARVPLSVKLPGDYAPLRTPEFDEEMHNDTPESLTGLLRGFLQGAQAYLTGGPHPAPVHIPSTGGTAEVARPELALLPERDEPGEALPLATGPPVETQAQVSAYLLGSFRVVIDQSMIDQWPGGHSRAVFAFLLAQRGKPAPRDLLMETFWPDSGLEPARNSLNVAIYGLRKTLRQALRQPVILFHDTAYQINPDLELWIDVEEFEQRVRAARQYESAGSGPQAAEATTRAVREYEMAVSLYQGDFLADAPYEDWTILERERLRVMHLDTLDHLSLVYFNQGQFSACISLCQRMLSYDACREDAHGRLMRSFSRQGQAHLALRQYQACVEALREELDVPPSPATTRLYEQIRRQEPV